MKERHIEELDAIALSLVKNFAVVYGETYNSPVFLISQTLSDIIAQEIKFIFSELQLTTMQRTIIRQNDIVHKLVGKLDMAEDHDIETGKGFKPSGLTKTYFNAFKSAILSNIIQKASQVFITCVLQSFHYYRTEPEDALYATQNTFNNHFKDRQKEIIFLLFLEIINYANEYQMDQLVSELKDNRNDIVNKLSLHRKFEAGFIKSSPFTFSCSYAQNHAIHKLAKHQFALMSMFRTLRLSYNLVRISENPLSMDFGRRKALCCNSTGLYTSVYVLFDKSIFYLEEPKHILPLSITNFSELEKIFPKEKDTLVKATSRSLQKIETLTNHRPKVTPPHLSLDLHRYLSLWFSSKDLTCLTSLNRGAYGFFTKSKRRLSDEFSRGKEYVVSRF